MSQPITISISHTLGKEEALNRIRPALSKAAAMFPVMTVEHEAWSGDQLAFRVRAIGQIASGTVDVFDDNVRLVVTLPWLLQKFAETIQKTIGSRGRILLEKK